MIYLDNAATSFPKPVAVIDEVKACLERYCGNPGRGGHPLSMAAADKIYECREELADFFYATDASHVIFTQNATAALNLAIKGLAKKGGHIITSNLEHNSVRRPLEALAKSGKCSFDVIEIYKNGKLLSKYGICAAIASKIMPNTTAVVITACPNVCSLPLPLSEIGALCHSYGILFIVDAAQAAGHFPIKIKQMQIDALALPGHKGLLGPQGSGALILGDGVFPEVLFEGGSGSASFDADMPDEIPERYEAGTLSTPAIAGLTEGIREVKKTGLDSIEKREKALFAYARDSLRLIRGVRIYLPEQAGSVLSFNVGEIPSDRIASSLGERGICVRGGYHCNPWAHTALGSEKNGSVRISFSVYNTFSDIDALVFALSEIAKK